MPNDDRNGYTLIPFNSISFDGSSPAKLAVQFRFQFSPLSALMLDGFERVQELIGSEEFTFVVNGESFAVRLSDAIVLSSEVYKSLESDADCRLFGVTTAEAARFQRKRERERLCRTPFRRRLEGTRATVEGIQKRMQARRAVGTDNRRRRREGAIVGL